MSSIVLLALERRLVEKRSRVNVPKTPIAIWGASGHALAVSNAVSLCGQYDIIGYLDNLNPNRKGEIFNGKPVLGGLEALAALN